VLGCGVGRSQRRVIERAPQLGQPLRGGLIAAVVEVAQQRQPLDAGDQFT
jgi:hypothetical protein